MAATYTKLQSGDWGVRFPGTAKAGQSVTVAKKSGETKIETIARVLWTGKDKTGQTVSLCAVEAKRRRYSDVDSRVCHACGHDGDMCAEMDCTCKTCGGMMR